MCDLLAVTRTEKVNLRSRIGESGAEFVVRSGGQQNLTPSAGNDVPRKIESYFILLGCTKESLDVQINPGNIA